MPLDSSSFRSPTPESCSSCGVLKAPPQRITLSAVTRRFLPFHSYSTPTAFVPSKSTLVVKARVRTSRLSRSLTGYR